MRVLTKRRTTQFSADWVSLTHYGQLVTVVVNPNPELAPGVLRITETRRVWHKPLTMFVDSKVLILSGRGGYQPSSHSYWGVTYTYSKKTPETVISSRRKHHVRIEYGGDEGIKVTQFAR